MADVLDVDLAASGDCEMTDNRFSGIFIVGALSAHLFKNDSRDRRLVKLVD